MSAKFTLRKKSPEQGNYTGRPWLILFPAGYRALSNGWTTMSSDGTSFDTFEEARRYMAHRLNEEALLHRRKLAAARRLLDSEAVSS